MADDEVVRRLDELMDLFTRRLLDDRQKRATIEVLQQELDHARQGLAAEYLLPLVHEIALVVDRLDRYDGADPEFAASVAAELVEALARQGVTEITVDDEFDPSRHEAVETTDRAELPAGQVVEVRRRGFAHTAAVLRPAQVVVNQTASEGGPA
ncbi:MAG: nucleotide exchange factor GrpE [Streptosporangiales bacterium]|nr:nucleotide exchange factor GrpE [Streptosporangiales bacterium]